MADLNSILYGQAGQNAFPGVPQVPPGTLTQASAPPEVPPAQLSPEALQGQVQQPQPAEAGGSPGMLDGFSSLVEKVRSDPALSQAAMMAGIRLAQGARPGQSPLSLLGDTVQMGMTAYNMLEGNKRTQGMADQAFQADLAGKQADTEGKVLTNQENRRTSDARTSMILEKAAILARAGQLDKAEQIVRLAKADFFAAKAQDVNSSDLERIWMSELQKAGLESDSLIGLRRAETARALEQVGEIGASADLTRAKMSDPARFHGPQPKIGAVETMDAVRKSVQLAEPKLTPGEVEKRTLELIYGARQKTDEERVREYVLQQAPANAKQAEELTAAAWAVVRGGKAKGGGAAPGSPGNPTATPVLPPLTKQRAAEIALKNKKPLQEVIDYYKQQGYPVEE